MKQTQKSSNRLSTKPVKAFTELHSNNGQSPYLKAVLTGKATFGMDAHKMASGDSSLAAALRYIANSK